MRLPAVVLGLLLLPSVLWGQKLVVAYNDDFAPLSFTDGGVKGAEIDLMNELGRRAHLAVEHVAVPWARAQQMVREGLADAFVTVATPERRDYALMDGPPLFVVRITAATVRSNPRLPELLKIRSIEDTGAFRQVNIIGTSFAQTLLKGLDVQYVASTESIYQILASRRTDLYVDADVSLRYNAQRLGLDQELVILPVTFLPLEVRVGISKRSPLAGRAAELNELVKALAADGTVTKVFRGYGGTD